jgi:hypothetical protein
LDTAAKQGAMADDLRLSGLYPCLGQGAKREERGAPGCGERPLCARIGCCEPMVRTKSAPSIPRAAGSSVSDETVALRLLWHLRQRQADQMVSPPSRSALEEVARSPRTPPQALVAAFRAMLARYPLPSASALGLAVLGGVRERAVSLAANLGSKAPRPSCPAGVR